MSRKEFYLVLLYLLLVGFPAWHLYQKWLEVRDFKYQFEKINRDINRVTQFATEKKTYNLPSTQSLVFKSETEFSGTVKALIRRNGLSMEKESFSKKENGLYSARLKGSFSQIMNFLKDLEEVKRGIAVNRIQMARYAGSLGLIVEMEYLLQ